jgi:demethylmenaquinone methyltransferase/2-methoxy-6-polyprenyl-1,4-benzoquinol methylase/phosphoethanolamine N-methyltransferase
MGNRQPDLETEGITMPRMAVFYDLLVGILTLGRDRRFRKEIVQLAGIGPGERVLDVGCGTGTLAIAAREAVGPDGEVVGVDATMPMIDRARKKARQRRAHVRFEPGLAEAIPAPDASFDQVLTTFTMHHFPGNLQARALAEMCRVLTGGGRLLIVDFPTGHGHGKSIHEKQEATNELVSLVESAGFVQVSSGPVSMLQAIYVSAHKP